MILAYISKPGLITQKTNIVAQKIEGTALKTYGMVTNKFFF